MKDYTDYMDDISVSAELHQKIMKRVTRKSPRRNRAVFRFAGLAACAAVILLCVWAVPKLFVNIPEDPGVTAANDGADVPDNPGKDAGTVIDTSIIGLPVDNFSLSDIQTEFEMDRMLFSQLSDFFSFGSPQMFAFVRVAETDLREEKDPEVEWYQWKQTSTLHILSVLWNRGGDVPETLSLSQNLYGGCEGNEINNLLRQGGVYLLPLNCWQDGDIWYITGDLDVLFEIDDRGRVWTHSPHEGFNRFDGEDADVLADAITVLTSDENFSAAITSFGYIARHWGTLAEVTVLAETRAADKWGYDRCQYSLSIDNLLSGAAGYWREEGEEIYAVSYTSGCLEQGGRYLLLLDPSEGGPYIQPDRAAKINDDGTITAVPLVNRLSTNVFEEYNGYTAAQMKEEAERAKAWHEAHVK